MMTAPRDFEIGDKVRVNNGREATVTATFHEFVTVRYLDQRMVVTIPTEDVEALLCRQRGNGRNEALEQVARLVTEAVMGDSIDEFKYELLGEAKYQQLRELLAALELLPIDWE